MFELFTKVSCFETYYREIPRVSELTLFVLRNPRTLELVDKMEDGYIKRSDLDFRTGWFKIAELLR